MIVDPSIWYRILPRAKVTNRDPSGFGSPSIRCGSAITRPGIGSAGVWLRIQGGARGDSGNAGGRAVRGGDHPEQGPELRAYRWGQHGRDVVGVWGVNGSAHRIEVLFGDDLEGEMSTHISSVHRTSGTCVLFFSCRLPFMKPEMNLLTSCIQNVRRHNWIHRY